MVNKIVAANKLDNGYWQITVLDNATQQRNVISDMEFYRVNNKDARFKNYIYEDANNSYIYFDKSYSPKFIAQLIYLYSNFAYENGILDRDILKIDTELNKQGLTLSKYGLTEIDSKTVYPCLDINPYPKDLQFNCINDSGKVIEKYIEHNTNYEFLTNILNMGEKTINISLWNFSYIVCGGVLFFLIIFLFVMRTDK